MALDVLAVLVTFSDDPPAACAHSACWSPFGPILDTPIHEDIHSSCSSRSPLVSKLDWDITVIVLPIPPSISPRGVEEPAAFFLLFPLGGPSCSFSSSFVTVAQENVTGSTTCNCPRHEIVYQLGEVSDAIIYFVKVICSR